MKHFVFAIRDIAINAFDRPWTCTHELQGLKAFREAVNDPNSRLSRAPEDYELYKLGTFDDGSGLFEVGVPEQVATGKSVFEARPVQRQMPLGGPEAAELIERLNGSRPAA